MFREQQFFYTLTPPRLGSDSVDDFLFDTKKGFCEHYASAFAALMRAGGVPARVVTGYQGGSYNRFAGYWIVRQSDAHAWTEIWIDGRGWVRADPTAAIAPERIERGSNSSMGSEGLISDRWYNGAPWLEDARLRLDALRQLWRDAILRFDQRSQLSILDALKIPGPDAQKLVLMLAAALIATSFWLTWQLRRDLRASPNEPAVQAFRAFERKLAAAGMAPRLGEPALELWARVSRQRPDLARSAESICRQYNTLRYGRISPGLEDLRRLRAAVRAFKP